MPANFNLIFIRIKHYLSQRKAKKNFAIRIGNTVYKIVWGYRVEFLLKETMAKKINETSLVWRQHGLYYKYLFKLWSIHFFSSRFLKNDKLEDSDLEKLTNLLINNARKINSTSTWKFIFHPDLFNQFWLALDQDSKLYLENAFSNFSLPKTGCHGDLGPDNILKTRSGYVIIDWEYFLEDGSMIVDLALMYFMWFKANKQLRVKDGYNPDTIIKLKILSELSFLTKLPEKQLALILSIYLLTAPYSGRKSLDLKNLKTFENSIQILN